MNGVVLEPRGEKFLRALPRKTVRTHGIALRRNNVWEFGCSITTNTHQRQAVASGAIPYYAQLLKEVVPFFQTGKSPLDIEESLNIIAFLEAASRSRAAGGTLVKIADL